MTHGRAHVDKDDVLRKIKACLARAKSTDSENEAATALRHAQALMRKHQLTDADVHGAGYSGERVDTAQQVGKGRRNKKTGAYTRPKIPLTLAMVIHLIKDAFGVLPVMGTDIRVSDESWHVTYFGPTERVKLAAYTHVVIARAIERAWKDYLTINPSYRSRKGGRTGFYYGWIDAVRKQIEDFAMTDDEKARTDLVVKEQVGGGLIKNEVGGTNMYASTASAGHSDGAAFKLHRPMGVERQQLEDRRDDSSED